MQSSTWGPAAHGSRVPAQGIYDANCRSGEQAIELCVCSPFFRVPFSVAIYYTVPLLFLAWSGIRQPSPPELLMSGVRLGQAIAVAALGGKSKVIKDVLLEEKSRRDQNVVESRSLIYSR